MDNAGVPGVAKGTVAVVALGTVAVLGGVTPEVAPGVTRTVTSISAAIVTRIGGGTIVAETGRASHGDGLGSGCPDTIGMGRRRSRRVTGDAVGAGAIEAVVMALAGHGQRTTVQTRSRVIVAVGGIGVTIDTVIGSGAVVPVGGAAGVTTEAVVGSGRAGIEPTIKGVAGAAVAEINIGFSRQGIAHIGNIVSMAYGVVRHTDMRQRARCLSITGLVTVTA